MKKFLALALTCGCLSSVFVGRAADLVLKVADKEPPTELGAAIRGELQSKAVQLLDQGQPVFEFWFVKELSLSSKPDSADKALDSVKEAALLGAVSVSKSQRDYRDDELAAGVYTMRFALQPKDGNHLGTSEFPYFAVLVQAKLDPAPDAIKDYKRLVKTSSRGTSSEHPVIVSLRPPGTETGDLPKLFAPAPDHKSVRVNVPGKVNGTGASVPLIFDVVYKGMGHK